MKRISKFLEKHWYPAAILMLLALISMTVLNGCSSKYVVIQGGEMVQVEKATLDRLYSDNERLMLKCSRP